MPGCQPVNGEEKSVGRPHTCHTVPSSNVTVSELRISDPDGANRIVNARVVSCSKVSVSYALVFDAKLIAHPGNIYDSVTA